MSRPNEPCPESRKGLAPGHAVVPSRDEATQAARAEMALRACGFNVPPIRWRWYDRIVWEGDSLFGAALRNRKSYSVLIATEAHPSRMVYPTALHELAHVACSFWYDDGGEHDAVFWAVYTKLLDAYAELS